MTNMERAAIVSFDDDQWYAWERGDYAFTNGATVYEDLAQMEDDERPEYVHLAIAEPLELVPVDLDWQFECWFN